MKTVGLLLAAGASSRMGKLKQVLPIKGSPMVRFAAAKLCSISLERVVVVIGNEQQQVASSLEGLDIDLCINPDWEKGIGSSLRAGVKSILYAKPDTDAILIALADQPLIPASHFEKLIQAIYSPSEIISSRYENQTGVPVVFGQNYFQLLLQIDDSAGANRIIQQNVSQVNSIDLETYLDIDTPDDYSKL